MWAWWKFICSQKKSFPDTAVARIQLGLANECIWWHIFIFMQLGLLQWKHICSSLHLLAFLFLFPLEIKWCKVSVTPKSAKIYKVDCLITDAQDWTKWNLCPILHIYSWNSACPVMILQCQNLKLLFLLFLICCSHDRIQAQLTPLSVPICFWNLLFWNIGGRSWSVSSGISFVGHLLYYPLFCYSFIKPGLTNIYSNILREALLIDGWFDLLCWGWRKISLCPSLNSSTLW